jgi:predicted transcriptional regulator
MSELDGMGTTTTSLRLPDDLREMYDTLVTATGRSRNELMVEALRIIADQKLREIELVQEGKRQIHAGEGIPFAEVVAALQADGMLGDQAESDFRRDAQNASY